MTRRTCPYLPETEQAPPPVDKPKVIKYQLKAPPDFRSRFLLELEDREREKKEAELQRQEEERQRMIAVRTKKNVDMLFNKFNIVAQCY